MEISKKEYTKIPYKEQDNTNVWKIADQTPDMISWAQAQPTPVTGDQIRAKKFKTTDEYFEDMGWNVSKKIRGMVMTRLYNKLATACNSERTGCKTAWSWSWWLSMLLFLFGVALLLLLYFGVVTWATIMGLMGIAWQTIMAGIGALLGMLGEFWSKHTTQPSSTAATPPVTSGTPTPTVTTTIFSTTTETVTNPCTPTPEPQIVCSCIRGWCGILVLFICCIAAYYLYSFYQKIRETPDDGVVDSITMVKNSLQQAAEATVQAARNLPRVLSRSREDALQDVDTTFNQLNQSASG